MYVFIDAVRLPQTKFLLDLAQTRRVAAARGGRAEIKGSAPGISRVVADVPHKLGGMVDVGLGPHLSVRPRIFVPSKRTQMVAHQSDARLRAEIHVAGIARGDQLAFQEQRLGQTPAE